MRGLILLALGLYVAYAVAAVILHPRFIYPFDQTPFALDGFSQRMIAEEVRIAEAPGDDTGVLYLMGNAGALALFPRTLTMHRAAGRYVIALEYPGGGGHPGAPSDDLLKAQALAAYDELVALTGAPAVVHGYSLGSSIALYVAGQREVAGVILDAPFARMCEQMARQSYLPACLLPGVQRWDSLAFTADVRAPVLIQHGSEDTLALPGDGARVAAALTAAGQDVAFHLLDGASHTTLIDDPAYQPRIDAFIMQLAQP